MGYPRIYYDNRLQDGTPAASSTAAGEYNVLNLRDFRPYTWWKPSSLPATVTVDCGSAQPASTLAIWGHDLGSKGATIITRGSTDNFSASDDQVDTHAPSTDLPFIRSWSSVSYRYWRLRITGSSAPSLAIACLGVPLELPAYMDEGFDPLARNPEGIYNRSVKGHPLGRVVEFEQWMQGIRLDLVTKAWLRSTWEPAWDEWVRDNPFIFAWDYDTYPTEMRLAVIKDSFKAPHKKGEYADLSFELVAVVPS